VKGMKRYEWMWQVEMPGTYIDFDILVIDTKSTPCYKVLASAFLLLTLV